MGNQVESNELKILTVNCQGLGDYSKRRDVLNYLKSKKHNVYFLQDTHFTYSEENYIQSQWGYKIICSSFTSNSRGVAILFNNNCELEVHEIVKDDTGNFLVVDVTIEGLKLILVNIYGPNIDSPTFYSNLFNKIENLYTTQYIIIGGDFNLIMDKELDSMNYKNMNNPKAREELLSLMDGLNLVDVFRINNPELKRFTWRRKNPIKQARLDFFLMSESLLPMSPSIRHENSYRSDHSPVVTYIKINELKKGKGFWKLNNSLLTDKVYVDLIKQKIQDIKTQYACPVYNMENLHDIDNENLQLTICDKLFLDTLLMEIRGKTISYSSYKKKKIKEQETLLEKEILQLEENITENTADQLANKQKEMEEIRKNKMKGQCIRSRVKWVDEGEKPTKYFACLESRNYISKQIPKLITEDGCTISNQEDIFRGRNWLWPVGPRPVVSWPGL
jgi:exonuclease III